MIPPVLVGQVSVSFFIEQNTGKPFAVVKSEGVCGVLYVEGLDDVDKIVADVRDLTASLGIGTLDGAGLIKKVSLKDLPAEVNRMAVRVAQMRLNAADLSEGNAAGAGG